MATVKGFQATAALKKGASWGTAATCGALSGIEILSEGITGGSALIERRGLQGNSQMRSGVAGPETYSGNISMDAVYEDVGLAFGLVFGTAATSGTQAPYTHTFTILDDLEGVFGTFAIKADTLEVHEYESVKFNGFELAAQPGAPATLRFDLIPNDLNFNTSTGSNTLTTMTNVTYAADRERALFSQAVVRMKAASTSTGLTSGDAVCLEGFSVSMTRNLSGKLTTCDGLNISEPQPNDFVTVSGSFTVPYHNTASTNITAWALAKTELMADIVFTGAAAGKKLTVELSGVQIDGKPSISGPAAGNVSYNFTAHAVATANSNFAGTDAICVKLLTALATNYLA
jgi:hypothetical protein